MAPTIHFCSESRPQATATDTEVVEAPAATNTEAPSPSPATSATTVDASKSLTQTASSKPEPITVPPVGDAYVSQEQATSNFGSAAEVRSDGAPLETAYVAFKVAGTGAVANAKLRLYVSNASTQPVELYGSGTDWDENTITWENAPSLTTGKVADIQPSEVGTWVEVDVSSIVRGDGVYSFALVNQHSDALVFASRESSKAPQLVIAVGQNTGPAVPTSTTVTGTTTVSIDKPASGTSYAKDTTVSIVVSATSTLGVTGIELYDNGTLITT